MNTRRVTLLLAILLAIGTGWLTLSYISSIQHANQANGQPQEVLVAAQDIPARVTITPAMLKREERPGSAVEPGAVSDPAKAAGQLALITIPAGSQITISQIGQPSQVGLPVRLTPGMRAVSIAIDKVKGVSGLVQPGDRVDVIAVPPRQGDQQPQAFTILRGIRVLAIGTTLEYPSATPAPDEQNATTVTLEVTPKQADLLAMADLNATLRLALRSPKEPIRSQPVEQLVFGGSGSSGAPAASSQSAGARTSEAIAAGFINALARDRSAGKGAAETVRFPAAQTPSGNVQLIVGDRVYNNADAANAQSGTDPQQ